MARFFYALTITSLFIACSDGNTTPPAQAVNWQTLSGEPPIIIAHRGASAYLPGHTLAAYELAIDQGADFIEPDLVLTKDNVLVCRHDRFLSITTNVADHPEFADRRVQKEGRNDWWVEDFTVDEIKTLRSREEEAAYYAATGKDITSSLVASLRQAGWTGVDAPVIVQSFEAAVLKELNEQIDVRLVQLTLSKTYFDADAAHESFTELDTIPEYADRVGPSRRRCAVCG